MSSNQNQTGITQPRTLGYYNDLVRKWFPGKNYMDWLELFHRQLKPRTYLEIGVYTGQSLQIATGATCSIGVDPELHITHSLSAWSKLYCGTSDDFFSEVGPTNIFQCPTELVFLDGLHTFDQTLRDLLNVEPHCDEKSVVLIHDVYPVAPETASRTQCTEFWLGDTWKIIPILRKHRPDLQVFVIPAAPSGLGVVTGFGGAAPSRFSFDQIVEEWMPVVVEDYIDNMADTLNVVDNSEPEVLRRIQGLRA